MKIEIHINISNSPSKLPLFQLPLSNFHQLRFSHGGWGCRPLAPPPLPRRSPSFTSPPADTLLQPFLPPPSHHLHRSPSPFDLFWARSNGEMELGWLGSLRQISLQFTWRRLSGDISKIGGFFSIFSLFFSVEKKERSNDWYEFNNLGLRK